MRHAFGVFIGISGLLGALLCGCGGLPETPETPTAAIAVIEAVDATTNKPLTVPAVVILGGVRGVIDPAEGSVVLRNVPFGTGTPPTQPLTVTAPGYVTFAELIQISMTVVTFYTASLQPADPAETGTVQGKITSTTGEPIVSALVKFIQTGPGGVREVRGYTDNQGEFIIGGIPIGLNTVTVEAAGFVTASTHITVIQDAGGGQTPAVNISLLPGTTQVDVIGQVVNSFTEAPVAGARVQFGERGVFTTNAQGIFRIAGVTVGTYEVTVTAEGYDELTQQVQVLPGMGQLRLALTPAAPLPPGEPYNVRGTVTLLGAPDNSGAEVTAVDTTTGLTWARVITPPSGEYKLFLPPGEYRLVVTYGAATVRRTITVPGGGRILTGIDFVLTVS